MPREQSRDSVLQGGLWTEPTAIQQPTAQAATVMKVRAATAEEVVPREIGNNYSDLNVSAGSILAIRIVGMNAAAKATIIKISGTIPSVTESCALTP